LLLKNGRQSKLAPYPARIKPHINSIHSFPKGGATLSNRTLSAGNHTDEA
jgi:hypothetical protein